MTLEEIREIGNFYGCKAKFSFKDVQRGTARFFTNSITIPKWINRESEAYQYYYVIHEVCHMLHLISGHGPDFKEKEKEMLAQWGLSPVYSKAYVKELKSPKGVTLFKRDF